MRTSEIGRTRDAGSRIEGSRVVVFLAPGSGRLAVVAAGKIGGAVERNRARRILRAAWRELHPEVGRTHDVVLVARDRIRGATSSDLVAEMSELLHRGEWVRA